MMINSSSLNVSSNPPDEDLSLALDISLICVFLLVAVCYVSSIANYLKKSGDISVNTLCKFGKESMLKMLMLSGVFSIVILLVSVIFVRIPFLQLGNKDFACDFTSDVMFFLYGLAQLMIYLYLWMRMKFYYEKYAETNTRSRCFVALTWISLELLLLIFSTLFIVNTYPTSYMYDQESKQCIFNPTGTQHLVVVSLGIIMVVTVSQLMILALIVSVLLKQRRSIKSDGPSSTSVERVSSGSRARLYLALKKLVFYTSLSIASDVSMTIIGMTLHANDFSVMITINMVGLFVNLSLMIGTFGRPSEVFCVFCRRQ